MFKNYFKITFRNLLRNKVYSCINIAGLSLGLACAMLITLYVKDEVSYDRFLNNVTHIYRIVTEGDNLDGSKAYKDSNTGYLQGPSFTANIPGIQSFVRIQDDYADIKKGTDIMPQDLLRVDANFFSAFSFPLLSGNPRTCLLEPHSIVISEDAAKRQFGTVNTAGKIMMLKSNNESEFTPYTVTGVTKRCPQNSSIKFDVLLPIQVSAADKQNSENWFSSFLNTFVVLAPRENIKTVEAKMQKTYNIESGEALKIVTEKYGPLKTKARYLLQPFTAMHLSKELPAQNGLSDASNPMYSYILTGIALFILLIACINFINLTVARSVKRAKEIGIRKVVGGNRKQLILQFLGESFLLCFIAFILAALIVKTTLPLFNNLSNKALAFAYLLDAKLIGGYIALFILTGLLAGCYPALVLSGYNPVQTLYNRFNLPGKNYLQKGLVVLQFTIASFLIIATITIFSQFNFLTTQKLGYDDSNLVVVKQGMKRIEARLLKDELMKDPGILGVASKNGGQWRTSAKVNGDSIMQFAYETIDESYLPLLKISVIKGRNFSPGFPSDSSHSVLVNETFVKKAGWKNPIGQQLNFWYDNNEKYTVVGVVKDHHFQPLSQEIGPQVFTMKAGNNYGMVLIRIRPNSQTASLPYIARTFKKLFPFNPYNYAFKDQENLKNYKVEAKWKQIMLLGAILTIFISCIGLFGLSVLSVEKRTKEIGIRKVLGASVRSVATILSKDFLKLVTIAMLIAVPVAWLAANKWLQHYPYRITLSWWIFAGAGMLVIFIALATVSFQAIRAAVSNPVEALRSE